MCFKMTVTLECGLYILQVMAFRVLGLPLPAFLCQEGTAQNLSASLWLPQSSSHALLFHDHSEATASFKNLFLELERWISG